LHKWLLFQIYFHIFVVTIQHVLPALQVQTGCGGGADRLRASPLLRAIALADLVATYEFTMQSYEIKNEYLLF
jgi:hypothetical protein